jgi:hypothetical protein
MNALFLLITLNLNFIAKIFIRWGLTFLTRNFVSGIKFDSHFCFWVKCLNFIFQIFYLNLIR